MTRLYQSYANRGMALENLIETTNQTYLNRGWAVVHKRPTPVKILRTIGTSIVSAHLEAPSTVDFNGVYQGRAIEFEAKSTKEDRFPLKNIHDHQVEHLRMCNKVGAITFCIIEFAKHQEVFFVHANMIVNAWDEAKKGGRKSISYDDFVYQCEIIQPTRGVPLDYLAVVDKLIEAKTA
ncbi:Holliday junction resolvase RecU [Alicyclobacillus fastidiosus]|uniref:Holliday junction resolvase RecU n=1 Tax=Alicyclobacillus fastidiosus TaxID=392011 RepID=A0ABV5ALP3_9BACL|nr:Holliday junction resolvase RecU [Alicyclobacillus fastidiosus]WEH08502.1 Holliday junction resolvase RecU [Alicyclobacillus fastidiosus]